MKICKCFCHTKGISIACYHGCCNHPESKYLNKDGTIDDEDIERLVDQSIDSWNRDRKARFIEYYPSKRKK